MYAQRFSEWIERPAGDSCACRRHRLGAKPVVLDASDFTEHTGRSCRVLRGRVQRHEARDAKALGLRVGQLVPGTVLP